jgi:hypothetical protein
MTKEAAQHLQNIVTEEKFQDFEARKQHAVWITTGV